MQAEAALTRMLELSSQIVEAVLARRDGSVLASSVAADARGADLARTGVSLLGAAADVRPGHDAERVVVELETGALVVVGDAERIAVATTLAEPTVAVVVYDLRTALHGLAAEKPANRRRKAV